MNVKYSKIYTYINCKITFQHDLCHEQTAAILYQTYSCKVGLSSAVFHVKVPFWIRRPYSVEQISSFFILDTKHCYIKTTVIIATWEIFCNHTHTHLKNINTQYKHKHTQRHLLPLFTLFIPSGSSSSFSKNALSLLTDTLTYNVISHI